MPPKKQITTKIKQPEDDLSIRLAPPILTPAAAGDEISPRVAVFLLLRAWWLLVGLMILGAIGGWLFHLTHPPVYEAVTSFSVRIDYIRTGNMSQFEEDMAIASLSDVLFSTPVLDQMAAQASIQGITLDESTLRRMTLAERVDKRWNLRVQDADPALAAVVAGLWAEVGQAAFDAAYEHALLAETIDRGIQKMQLCLDDAVVIAPVQPECAGMNFENVQANLFQTGQALADERAASRGIITGIHLESVETAPVSSTPVRFGVEQLLLSGGLIGLLAGILLGLSGLLKRWVYRK